ncbi:hypothetical protein GDO86_014307 [Hymenochirus boettgeri]|uniref:Uncharacterized protein n=1 Tax=Hymenochirus boettgeri TaxID=247094 RepID=A0A8T2JT93_9PIPI|nr:hypothetical protein GDO86_014307 [Hymenochirus boettgeri]
MSSLLRQILILFFTILTLSCECSGAPSEPQHPGDQASPDELAQYYSDLYQYITFITRPRFGKRWEKILAEDRPSI